MVDCSCGAPAGQYSSVEEESLVDWECMTMKLWRFGCLCGETKVAATPHFVRHCCYQLQS